MSLQVGDNKYQDTLPIDIGPRLRLDPRIHFEEKKSPNRSPHRLSPPPPPPPPRPPRRSRPSLDDAGFDMDTETAAPVVEDDGSSRRHRKRHRDDIDIDDTAHRRHRPHRAPQPKPKRARHQADDDRRRYRPSSPTDSVCSADFDMLADKNKLKDAASEVEPKKALPREKSPFERMRSRRDTHVDLDAGDDEDDADVYETGDEDDEFDDDDEECGSEMDDEGGGIEDGVRVGASAGESAYEAPRLTYEQQIQKKAFLLAKFDRRRQHGPLKVEVNNDMTLEELMLIDNKLTYQTRGKVMVDTMRRMTMFYIVIMEMIADAFPRLHLDLHGFSESMMQKQTENDELLYEIWDMYHERMQINPIWQHVVAITSQALMYSIGQKVMKNGMAQVMNMVGGAVASQQQPGRANQPQMAPPRQMAQPPSSAQPSAVPMAPLDSDLSMQPQELLRMLREEEQQKIDQQQAATEQPQQQQPPPQPQTGEFKTVDLSNTRTSTARPSTAARRVEIVKEKKTK